MAKPMTRAGGGRTARRATNVSIDSALVAAARELGVNISQASEQGLAQAVADARRRRWLAENGAALDAYNAWIEAHGLPLEKQRLF